jgi:murein DD-endopeptidase MepM/ murein hydrolase activator NlpD
MEAEMKPNLSRYIVFMGTIALIAAFFLTEASDSAGSSAQAVDAADDGRRHSRPADEIREELRREIWADINENIEKLAIEGRLAAPTDGIVPLMWPTAKASGLRDFSIGQIPYFVDQNPAFPGQIVDWNCGVRTYDRSSGYNHQGTDVVSFPFPWGRMDNNEALVVAAAAGTIISKSDGFFDRNCGGPHPVNRIIILHPDNSKSWYLHLKNGSLTKKEVGDTVVAGEYLGVPGSSGDSDVPHLHFELYNSLDQLQDPYDGPCNTMNNFSWWASQPLYRVSQINSLMTASALPISPGCPNQETTFEKIVFQPLDPLVTITALRDLLPGQDVQFSLIQPDESMFQSWSFTAANTFNATIRTAQWVLPGDAQPGAWTFRVVFNGQTYERIFYVGQPPHVSVSGRITRLTGRPVSGATVVMQDGTTTLSARTNPFGHYLFSDVPVGETFNVTVSAKGLTFLPRVLLVGGELTDFDHFSLNDQ